MCTLTRGKEATVRATRPDSQPHALGTLGAVSLIRRFILVHIDTRVDIAAEEMAADEASGGCPGGEPFIWRLFRKIEIFTDHILPDQILGGASNPFRSVLQLRTGDCSYAELRQRCQKPAFLRRCAELPPGVCKMLLVAPR